MKPLGRRYQGFVTEEFRDKSIRPNAPAIPFFSSVTEELIEEAAMFGPNYWVSNLVSPVRFKSAITLALKSRPKDIYVEIGPHSTLAGPINSANSDTSVTCPYVSTLQRDADCEESLLSAFGTLYQYGATVNLENLVSPGTVLADIPTYPWDHSGSYWHELQASKDWRFRKFGHHNLLGLRVPETTGMEPCWRNALSLEDEPWLNDHKVQSNVAFPMSAYCAMALEGVRQITGIDSDFMLNHVFAQNPLLLTDTAVAEIRTTLHPDHGESFTEAKSWSFSICSHSESGWVVNCQGQIQLRQMALSIAPKSGNLLRKVNELDWYDALAKAGFMYGPAFQCLSSIHSSASNMIATGKVMLRGERMLPLDACWQLSTVAFCGGLRRNLTGLSIPSGIEQISVSHDAAEMVATAWSDDNGKTFNVECRADDELVLRASGLHLTQPTNDATTSDDDSHAAAELEWRPHFDFISHDGLLVPPPWNVEGIKLREKVTLFCMIDTSERLRDLEAVEPFLLKYRGWLGHEIEKATTGEGSTPEGLEQFLDLSRPDRVKMVDDLFSALLSMSEEDAFTLALKRVWERIESIYTGKDHALKILMEDNLLTRVYNDCSFDHSGFIQMLAHTNPNLKILEVGAGTGGTTQTFLKSLIDASGYPSYELYTFTDISDGFFPQAKERFSYAPNMDYRVFDISKDPLEQGFEAKTYNLILATNVVHATPVLRESLENLRKLLNAQGHMVLVELISTTNAWNYGFGILSGWWLGEADGRPNRPNVTIDRWDKELRAAGFSGANTVVYDGQEPHRYCAAIISQPMHDPADSTKYKKITILCNDRESEMASSLEGALLNASYSVSFSGLEDELPDDQDVISILDLENSFLAELTESKLIAIQKFLGNLTTRKLLWLTPPSQVSCQDPRPAHSVGLIRSVRSELSSNIFTLEIEPKEREFAQLALEVLQKIQASDDTQDLLPDREFAIFDGLINVGRYRPFSLEQRSRELDTDHGADVKTLDLDKPSSSQGSHIWHQEPFADQIPSDHVEIEVQAIGIEHANPNVSHGSATPIIQTRGLAGTIRRVGVDEQKLAIGDRVMALWPHSSLTTHAIVLADLAVKIPDTLSFDDAASMPASFAVAIRSLIDIGQLKGRHSVLIHSAASPLGLAAIAICRMTGAKIFATVESEDEVEYLTTQTGLDSNHVFLMENQSHAADLRRRTEDRGVDIILGSEHRDLLCSSWRCLAKFGKFVDTGAGDLSLLNKADLTSFLANRSYHCVDLTSFTQDLPAEIGR